MSKDKIKNSPLAEKMAKAKDVTEKSSTGKKVGRPKKYDFEVTHTTIRLPARVHDLITAYAYENKTTITEIVTKLLGKFLLDKKVSPIPEPSDINKMIESLKDVDKPNARA